ncbi:MAG TPA: sulfatase-like hydrolase/transferase [Acidobacteriaceae bacterium]
MRMSKTLRAVAAALGLTTACVAWLVEPLVEPTHNQIYHWDAGTWVLFGPVALDIAIVWVVATLLLLSAERPGRWRVAVWAAILICLPWILVKNLRIAWPNVLPHGFQLPQFIFAVVAWALVVLLWRRSFSRRSDVVIEFGSTVLAFVAISGALFLTQFTWVWWQARSLNDPLPLHQKRVVAAADDPHPRIIWIVLDELSYQQVYEHRYPGLELPAFDALAADATVFTHVRPAGKYTEKILPGLMTGQRVDDLRSSASGQLSIHGADTGKWQRFDEHNSVFQDALNDGYETAVVGWFNPYCRMLAAVLNSCYCSYSDQTGNGLNPDGTFESNMFVAATPVIGKGSAPLLVWRLLHLPEERGSILAGRLKDYRKLSAAADRVLQDKSADFALLHLPIPHPFGIYDRATGQLTTHPTTYIDNLALADRYVAHVRSLLEQSGQWDSSTVIIMGDHGWRTTLLWEHMSYWTPEEERASDGGKFDDRPGYIVKLAGQKSGNRIDLPFRAVETRALMDALMAGKIRSPEDLQAWVKQSVQNYNH